MSVSFSPAALKFLRDLKRHNDRDWFNRHKAVFEREWKAPMLALIEDLNHGLLSFAPEHVRPAHRVLMRIYRDIRFSADKRPYKTHCSAWWVREGLEKTSGAGFYLQISPESVLVAAGVYMPEREQLLALRRHLSAHPAELPRLTSGRRFRSLLQPGWETDDCMRLSRVPKGFLPDDPAAELIRCRQWGMQATLPAETALGPALGKEILSRFRASAPVVAFLNQPLIPQKTPRSPF